MVIKAIYAGSGAPKASSEEAGGLDPILYLSHTARIYVNCKPLGRSRNCEWSNGRSDINMLRNWRTTQFTTGSDGPIRQL